MNVHVHGATARVSNSYDQTTTRRRFVRIPTTFTWAIMLGLGLLSPQSTPTHATDNRFGVSLKLTKVSAERDSRDTLFQCNVTIDNHTGREIITTSNFYSVFDGLALVVTNAEGKLLKQQPYTHHQSPFSPSGREFILKPGKTSERLAFPVSWPEATERTVKVQLIGTLPGVAGGPVLQTDTIRVAVKSTGIRNVEQTLRNKTAELRKAPELPGKWEYVLVNRKGRLKVVTDEEREAFLTIDNRTIRRTVVGTPITMEYTLDTRSNPHNIDITVMDNGKEKVVKGVLAIRRTVLILKTSQPGKPRPKAIDFDPGEEDVEFALLSRIATKNER